MTRTIFYALIVFIAVAMISLTISVIGITNPWEWIKAFGFVGGGAIVGYILGVKSKKDESSDEEK